MTSNSKRLSRIFVGLVVSLAATQTWAATYYVSTSGADTNPGSLVSPWRSIQFAVDRAAQGDTILIRGGTYAGATINAPASPTNGLWTTLKAFDPVNELVTVTADGNPGGNNAALAFNDSSCNLNPYEDPNSPLFRQPDGCRKKTVYYRVENLRLRGTWACTAANCYTVKIEAPRVRLIKNDIAGSTHDLVKLTRQADDVEIIGNDIHEALTTNNAQAIDVVGAARTRIQFNYIHDVGDIGIYVKGSAESPLIESNKIQRTKHGIWLGEPTDPEFMRYKGYNRLHETFDAVISNNIVIESLKACVGIGSSYNVRVVNNSCFSTRADQHAAIFLAPSSMLVPAPLNENINVRNNIVHNNFLPVVTIYEADGPAVVAATIAFNNNVYWTTAGASGIRFDWASKLGADRSFVNWQSIGQDAASRVADPRHIDPTLATTELRLAGDSPAIDRGDNNVCPQDEYHAYGQSGDTRPRGAACDVGADEYAGGNTPPTAAMTANPISGATPLTVSFDGSQSSDAEGPIASYNWKFGDGTSATGATVTHTYTTAGTYSATLVVTDASGATGNTARTISAQGDTPPTARMSTSSTRGNTPLTVNFDGSASSDAQGSIASHSWNFGDGMSGSGATVSHAYTVAGSYTATLTVADSAGQTNATQTTITVQTAGAGNGLKGEYFDNQDFTNLKVTRIDPTVDFSWGGGSPDPSVGPESFSVRWTGQVEPQYSQTYTFYANTDDGVRVWVNDLLVIDQWWDRAATESSGSIALVAGQKANIKIEYFDSRLTATAQLSWSSASQPKQVIPTSRLYSVPINVVGAGLKGEYFDNQDFTALKVTRTDPTVNFNWGAGSPDLSVGAESFSVRWTGQIKPQFSETYRFYANTDDGVRLWVNNQLVIDQWWNQAATESSGTITLVAGQKVNIKMEYYDSRLTAVAQLSWSSPSQPKQIVPSNRLYP